MMNLSNQHSILPHSNRNTHPKKKGKYFFLKYIIIAVLIFLIISYYHVGGGEISGIKNISTEDTVYAQIYDDHYQMIDEKKLNPNQIEAIKSLILNSHFTKYLSNTLRYEGKHYSYRIRIEDKNNKESNLYINITGNVSLTTYPNYDIYSFLKIRTSDFEKQLKSILDMN